MTSIVVIDEIDNTLSVSLRSFLGSKESDIHSLLRQFYNVRVKNIRPRPRKIHMSREIQQHPLFLNEKREVIEQIVTNIKAGADLTKYLSEKSAQLEYYDKSLAYFDVHHFHLGEKLQTRGARKGRVKGTKSLLFARVLEDDIYLLDILNHDSEAGFLNIRLFRIMHQNWPDSIESYRIKGAIGVNPKCTDLEAALLLENNINVFLEFGTNQVFLLPGLGTTTVGTSTLIVTRTFRTIRMLREISTLVSSNSSVVARGIMKITDIGYNTIRLRGRVRVGILEIYDARSGCSFFLDRGRIVIIKF